MLPKSYGNNLKSFGNIDHNPLRDLLIVNKFIKSFVIYLQITCILINKLKVFLKNGLNLLYSKDCK